MEPTPHVIALSTSPDHAFGKSPAETLTLVAGLGVAGDAHFGAEVQHQSRVAKDPSQPNLRQVHLIDTGLIAHLAAQGFTIRAGDIGDNILLEGAALIELPAGTQIALGGEDGPLLTITGLRNPCLQLDRLAPGLMKACLDKHADGDLKRLAGVMAVVTIGGQVRVGDEARIAMPPLPHRALAPV